MIQNTKHRMKITNRFKIGHELLTNDQYSKEFDWCWDKTSKRKEYGLRRKPSGLGQSKKSIPCLAWSLKEFPGRILNWSL